MNIGINIYTLRKEKKITQAQLAEKLGVSEQAISKWENNQCAPDVSLFPIIADYFGVSIDRLFGYHMNSYADEVKAVMKEKNTDEEDGVAEKVGVGAVIFYALSSARIKDLVFSYDKALSFEGETGPYLQYTHARCRSVIKKAGQVDGKFDISALDSSSAYEVIKLLNEYDSTVIEAGEKYEPSVISHYLISLAKAYNKFYLENRIVVEDKDITYTRVLFTKYVADALKNGLGLILIDAPNKM